MGEGAPPYSEENSGINCYFYLITRHSVKKVNIPLWVDVFHSRAATTTAKNTRDPGISNYFMYANQGWSLAFMSGPVRDRPSSCQTAQLPIGSCEIAFRFSHFAGTAARLAYSPHCRLSARRFPFACCYYYSKEHPVTQVQWFSIERYSICATQAGILYHKY